MNKRLASEKYLVVEQKGWRVVALGLAIATLFSLTFKAVFSPRRIQYEIERALSASDPRIKSSIEGAYLSLADGLWPRLAIVIEKLHVQSTDPCLFEAKADIENLVLPVAFSSILDRMLVFKRIEVGNLNLQMRARREGCGGVGLQAIPPLPQTLTTDEPPKDPKAPPLRDNLERPPLVQTMSVESSFLRHVVFHQVHLHFVEWPLFQWNLKSVDVQLPQKGESKTHIEGAVTLISDPTRFPFQGIHARLEVDSDAEQAEANIHGAWREGRVEVKGQWSPNRKDFHWKGVFKQIPWSQLIVLAHALGEAGPLPASSQAWVTAQVEWNHGVDSPETVEVDEGHIEGEFGDFVLGKVIAQREGNVDQWQVDPYKVLAKQVDLDILTKMMGWQEPPSTFDRLGFFDGEALFTDNQLVSMSGVWKDLEIIFSNRGLRELQKVNNINLELTGGSNKWAGFLKKIDLAEGQWNGDIAIKLDQNAKTVDLDTQFTQFKLNPQVEELMTVEGQLSPIDGRLSLKFVDGKASHINGIVKFERGVINEVSFEKARIEFDGQSEMLSGKLQTQALNWPRSRLEYWPQSLPAEYESLQIKNISGQFVRTPQTMEIKDFQGLLTDFKARFQMEAGWSASSDLHGTLQIRGDRKNQTFQLSGTRQTPVWDEHIK